MLIENTQNRNLSQMLFALFCSPDIHKSAHKSDQTQKTQKTHHKTLYTNIAILPYFKQTPTIIFSSFYLLFSCQTLVHYCTLSLSDLWVTRQECRVKTPYMWVYLGNFPEMWAEELLYSWMWNSLYHYKNPSAHISGKLPTYKEKAPPLKKTHV